MALNVHAQKSIQELVNDGGKEKIRKRIVIDHAPVSGGGFSDGHGRNPLLTSKTQLPDTIALISYYVQDVGSMDEIKHISLTYHNLSEEGGNYFANETYARAISSLKEEFKRQGAVLLTPDEFLNTSEKRNYYYDGFQPKVTKVGDWLAKRENKQIDMVAAAKGFRIFDVVAAWDALRAESLAADLAKKLGVKGVLSIQIGLQDHSSKKLTLNQIKIALNGPNPVPKEDKRYVAQNLGNGYYYGNIYSLLNYTPKKPIPIATFKKKKIDTVNLEGIEVVLTTMIETMYESMNESIGKAARKYK